MCQWLVTDYVATLEKIGPRCIGQNDGIEDGLVQQFPPCETEEWTKDPCVFVDNEERILVVMVFSRLIESEKVGEYLRKFTILHIRVRHLL